MIKRFIKNKSMTVTQAINCYGESCNAVQTTMVEDSHWLSIQHVRLLMGWRYRDYLRMSDAHLAQVLIEFEKRVAGWYNFVPEQNENAGVLLLEKSIVPCDKIFDQHGDLERCIPIPDNEVIRLACDLIKYEGEYQWFKRYHSLIPLGKLLYLDLVDEMERIFKGRIPGRHVWHTHKK